MTEQFWLQKAKAAFDERAAFLLGVHYLTERFPYFVMIILRVSTNPGA